MNEIEKQILKNQQVMMRALFRVHRSSEFDNINDDLRKEWNKTIDLLNPQKEQTLPERTHKFLCKEKKQGEICIDCKQIIGTNTMCSDCARFRERTHDAFSTTSETEVKQ